MKSTPKRYANNAADAKVSINENKIKLLIKNNARTTKTPPPNLPLLKKKKVNKATGCDDCLKMWVADSFVPSLSRVIFCCCGGCEEVAGGGNVE